MKITICSLFPEYFNSPLVCSILARAQNFGKLTVECLNYRDFAQSPDRRVDDRPYGGGPGMILQPQVLARAIRSIGDFSKAHCIHLSAVGRPLTSQRAKELSLYEHLILICGHYEGIDQRAIDLFADEEISLGDFILTSGCPAALALLDAVTRQIPGVLGHPDSTKFESFESGLLEAPQFTKPRVFEEMEVPAILRSGDHRKISDWKEHCSIEKTRIQRPDLLHRKLGEDSPARSPPKTHEQIPRALKARWQVSSLREAQIWFSEIWPFQVEKTSDTTLLMHIGHCAFELLERPGNTQKNATFSQFAIDLPNNLSKLVWERAQTESCEILKTVMTDCSEQLKPHFTGQVCAVDPEGILWCWNCSF